MSRQKKLLTVFLLVLHCLVGIAVSYQLTVLHTNDLHSRFDEVTASGGKCKDSKRGGASCFGGVARIKTAVDQLMAEHPNSVFLNAGDFFQVSFREKSEDNLSFWQNKNRLMANVN